MSNLRAAITGMGAITGFGAGAETLWTGLVAGGRALLVADPPPGAPDRAKRMAVAAARAAFADAGHPASGERLGVTCGTTLGGIDGWLDALRSRPGGRPGPGESAPAVEQRWSYASPARAVAAALAAEGPVEVASVACASSNVALGRALDLIRRGRCDAVVAGGVDALNDFVLGGFTALKALDPDPCRPFDRARRGLNLGEGACFLVVEAEPHARRRGAPIRAFLDGWGVAGDAVHMTGPDREGGGAARAMRAALADAGLAAGEVGFVSAHGTATVFNDLMEARALEHVLGEAARRVPVNSIKGALGHTLGAAAALEALMCVRVLETGVAPPTAGCVDVDPAIALDVICARARELRLEAVLSTSSGFGGVNAAIVLRRA